MAWADQFQMFASQQACWGFVKDVYFSKEIMFHGDTFPQIPWFWRRVNTHQGGLDLRYLEDRYHKGKKRVQELMSAQHALQAYPSLVLAHADSVQKQASLGNSTFLAWSNYKY